MFYFILGIAVWQLVIFIGESTKYCGEDFLTYIYTFIPSTILFVIVFPYAFVKRIYHAYKLKKYLKNKGAE